MTDTTVTNDPPQGNQPEARMEDGTLKDQSPESMTPSPTPTPKPEGGSFLTRDPAPEATPPKDEGKPAPKEGDPKPDGEKPPAAAVGAPEKYEDFKLPEGYKMDEATGKEVTALFKELNLNQEGAQKLVDVYAARLLKAEEAPYKAWADTKKEWEGDIADRFGSKAEKARQDINSAITNALPPSLARAFRTALDITVAGSNPDIFEALSILARPHLEGKPIAPGNQSPEANKSPTAPVRPSLAEAMYPHLAANRGQ